MQRWHPSYTTHVLKSDFRFATWYLSEHLLNALTAHVRTVKRLPDPHVQGGREQIRGLEAALVALHDQPPPTYRPEVPDLYFAINRELEAKLGEDTVSFLRMGLSRNDLDMTVYKMRARALLLELGERLGRVQRALLEQAREHLETVLVAFTHHQPGQPTSVAHYLLAVHSALGRSFDRLLGAYERLNRCPLGAAALAGSSHPLDRAFTASTLGFAGPVLNTYDAVASSDWQVDFVSVAQDCALILSRFTCDLLEWASLGLYELDEGLVQGSSIMPQKRNPVAIEHARTRFSRALGAGQMVLYSSHNIPYGDLNDFGPDIQGALQTLFLQLDGGLELIAACLESGRFDTARLRERAQATDTTATELADELVRHHQMSFQAAHKLVAGLVTRLANHKRPLRSATPKDILELGGPSLEPEELRQALDPFAFIQRRNGTGGPAPEVVHEQLTQAEGALQAHLGAIQQQQASLEQVSDNLRTVEQETA